MNELMKLKFEMYQALIVMFESGEVITEENIRLMDALVNDPDVPKYGEYLVERYRAEHGVYS
jgi:hypothetical protein